MSTTASLQHELEAKERRRSELQERRAKTATEIARQTDARARALLGNGDATEAPASTQLHAARADLEAYDLAIARLEQDLAPLREILNAAQRAEQREALEQVCTSRRAAVVTARDRLRADLGAAVQMFEKNLAALEDAESASRRAVRQRNITVHGMRDDDPMVDVDGAPVARTETRIEVDLVQGLTQIVRARPHIPTWPLFGPMK